MQRAISRRDFLTRVSAVGAVAGAEVGAIRESAQASAINPDPEHLRQQGRGWRVLPNGIDDHANLEWALLNTASGGTVKLIPGTYNRQRRARTW